MQDSEQEGEPKALQSSLLAGQHARQQAFCFVITCPACILTWESDLRLLG